MIYSKKLQTYVPITVISNTSSLGAYGVFTKYNIMDNKIPVGYLDVLDKTNGINVLYIENMNPQLYSGFGKIADQIEVEHCLNRGLKNFTIESEAALNSHALHYLRGKRFRPFKINEIVKEVIEKTPKGEKYNTKFLGKVAMYMPSGIINKYIEIIKKSPLLKR